MSFHLLHVFSCTAKLLEEICLHSLSTQTRVITTITYGGRTSARSTALRLFSPGLPTTSSVPADGSLLVSEALLCLTTCFCWKLSPLNGFFAHILSVLHLLIRSLLGRLLCPLLTSWHYPGFFPTFHTHSSCRISCAAPSWLLWPSVWVFFIFENMVNALHSGYGSTT